jgi:hypothetical protein
MRINVSARLTAAALALPLLALTTAGLASPTATAASAATTVIKPGALPRGEAPQVPYLDAGTIVDGDVRVEAPAGARLLGATGDDYLVLVPEPDGSGSVELVHRDGSHEQVRGTPTDSELMLSTDGTRLVRWRLSKVDGAWTTRIAVHDSRTGDRTARRDFAGIVQVLDADEGRMVLSRWNKPRTFWWNADSFATARISEQVGYAADIRADRVATYTGDPYEGGCSVLRTLSSPRDVLSRSCTERVTAISPSGRRVATIHILADGLGPHEVTVRRDHGRRLARYEVDGWFGRVMFETNRNLLLEAAGRRKMALVRCDGATCERTTPARPTPQY